MAHSPGGVWAVTMAASVAHAVNEENRILALTSEALHGAGGVCAGESESACWRELCIPVSSITYLHVLASLLAPGVVAWQPHANTECTRSAGEDAIRGHGERTYNVYCSHAEVLRWLCFGK
jgi:hypothetical protein